MTAGIADPRRLPIFGSSGLTRRSTSAESSSMTLDLLDVDLVGEQLEQVVVRVASPRSGSASHSRRERLADPDAGLAAQRPGQVDGPADDGHRRLERARRGTRARSRGRPGASGGRCRARRARPTATRFRTARRPGTAGSARASGAGATSAAWSVANAASWSAGRSERENRRRDRRRYQVDRSSMNARQRPGRAERRRRRARRVLHRGRGAGRARQDPAVEDAAARRRAAAPSTAGVQPASRA